MKMIVEKAKIALAMGAFPDILYQGFIRILIKASK